MPRSRVLVPIIDRITEIPAEGGYTFPTTTFNFPLLPDDAGTGSSDGMASVADYGLVANSVGDAVANTTALQDLITDQGFLTTFSRKTIFFPDGTWYLSGLGASTRGIMEKKTGGEYTHGLRIQGQSETGAIIRLKDNDADFQDAADPRFIIFQSNFNAAARSHGTTDGTGLESYKHMIRDLTIDLGAGNEGAVGINVMMHNQGAIRRVTVQDAVGAGRSVVEVDRAYGGFTEVRQGAGPNLLHRITVKGCEYGFRIAGPMCGQLIEHLRLVNQGTCGVTTDSNGLFIRGLVAEDMTVPVAQIQTGDAMDHFDADCFATYASSGWVHSSVGMAFYDDTMGYLLIVDAVLEGTGSASGVSAISNGTPGGTMFLRNITTTGFARAADEDGTAVDSGADDIIEYATTPNQNVWDETPTSLDLPITDTPEHEWSSLSEWSSVVDLGVNIAHGGPTSSTTYAALQDAIDNCTTDTLYFPSTRDGRCRVSGSGTLIVRGTPTHIVGMGMEMGTGSAATMELRFEHTAGSEPIIWEDFHESGLTINVVVDTSRDVVLKDTGVGTISNTADATGTVFLENVVTGQIDFANSQNLFSRQHNADGGGLVAQYSGGDFVCLYVKSEPQASASSCRELPTTWSGRIEILGGWMASTAGITMTSPIWECRNSGASIDNELSVAGFATSLGGTSGTFDILTSETQNGTTRTMTPSGSSPGGHGGAPNARGSFSHLTLYRSKMT